MTAQIVEIDGKRMAFLPEEEYTRLLAEAEEHDDVRAAIEAEDRARAGEEYVPLELVDRLIAGDNPLRVWRKYRSLTQQALAEKVGRSKVFISGIETGKQDTSSLNWRMLADALDVDIDDLIPPA